ncbi:AzlC family ABC transporter permease [Gracilibacillus salinarum]|uniref:AzlC family ABC transporter permease n=1 Tax=Gracilibacillus salinarum TaxID=2932255 RepID=A0ABY4GN59_9BACI|nr:AzlC family ABC transporter permease [Gracilibacillus salinarum]UOQ84787.1 AzlC family ABC transporter permease [Gracilibacillus salinarum]
MTDRNHITAALRSAFPLTIPIMAGFIFLGIAYGIYMNSLGFHPIYPILMSLVIYSGSMEFLAATLLLATFNPLYALVLTIMVNARHIFYGISMLEKYKGMGKKKFYLIYGLSDEAFSINSTADIPRHIDRGWFMFFVTMLNHGYWVVGSIIGAYFGAFIPFNTEGLEFVLTALFVVILMDNWMKEKNHRSAGIGLCCSVICLVIFGGDLFIIPTMFAILAVLTILRKPHEKVEVSTV